MNRGDGDHDGRCRACLEAGAGPNVSPAKKERKKKLEWDVDDRDCEHAEGGRSRIALARSERRWDARRRDPRVNGADLYVVRVSKAGTGSAKPFWRCVRWCPWSDVKRIFHRDPVLGRFGVLKANGTEGCVYETSSDARLFAGAVCEDSFFFWFQACLSMQFANRIRSIFSLASKIHEAMCKYTISRGSCNVPSAVSGDSSSNNIQGTSHQRPSPSLLPQIVGDKKL